MRNDSLGIVFPNATQLLLIKALVGSDVEFVKYWKQWRNNSGNYDKLDGGTLRIFPLAFPRLRKLLPNDSWLQVAKNAHRYHWLHNQVLLNTCMTDLRKLDAKKIPFLILKGGAYIPLYYKNDFGSRNLEDIDILVSNKNIFITINVLKRNGWKLDEHQNLAVFHSNFCHSISLHNDKGKIDVHSHAFHNNLQTDDYTFFSSNSQVLNFNNQKISALSNSANFLHACVHGLRWSELTQLRWIIDAIFILKREQVVWSEVIYLAQKTNSVAPLRIAIIYLRKNFSIQVPKNVLIELEALPTRLADRRLFELNLQNIQAKPVSAFEFCWWVYYNSIRSSSSPYYSIKMLVKFLQYLTQTKELYKVPLKILYRLRKLFSAYFAQSFV